VSYKINWRQFGGGGHTNASGFTRHGDPAVVRRDLVERLTRVLAGTPVPARG
jgi:nanoRNase/pAp phosphatase (c-di-AMP/oligoRNAs hydrolase)